MVKLNSTEFSYHKYLDGLTASVCEDMGGLFMIDMQIPDYFIKSVYSHYKRIAESAVCDPTDTKTANALRLSKGDLRKLEKYINKTDQNSK